MIKKKQLADAITKVVVSITGNDESDVSVSIEDIMQSDLMEKVYKPDIEANRDKLYKEPGYGPW